MKHVVPLIRGVVDNLYRIWLDEVKCTLLYLTIGRSFHNPLLCASMMGGRRRCRDALQAIQGARALGGSLVGRGHACGLQGVWRAAFVRPDLKLSPVNRL